MIAFSLGSIHIYWYGIFYLVTCLIGYIFLWYVGKEKWFGKHTGIQKLLTKGLDDLILGTIIGILVGGRLGHVFIYSWDYYQHHIGEIFAIRQGGMSFIGGILGVIVAIFVVEKMYKLSRREFFIVFDLLLLIVPIGIVLGRLGNYLNQELYGIVVPQTLQWLTHPWLTHVYTNVDNLLRFNTNFISAIFEGLIIWIVLVTLCFKQRRAGKRKPGLISVTFIIMYSVIRFLLEYLRQDSQSEYMGSLTTTQWFMVLFLGFGFVLWFMHEED